eukprot:9405947-Lingulodinium_polyedra.AAC.1
MLRRRGRRCPLPGAAASGSPPLLRVRPAQSQRWETTHPPRCAGQVSATARRRPRAPTSSR